MTDEIIEFGEPNDEDVLEDGTSPDDTEPSPTNDEVKE